MIQEHEIKTQIAIESAELRLHGPYRDKNGLLWPKGKPLISCVPSHCKIVTDPRKWSV